MKDATKILKRHPDNPIITREDVPGAMAVFNPSPVMYGEQTILVLSVLRFQDPGAPRGAHIARSDDGVHFEIEQEPFMDMTKTDPPFNKLAGSCIDNRISKIDDVYYFLTPTFSAGGGPFALLGKTEDFKTYTPIEIVSTPTFRGTSLFPGKINGKYYRLDRPGSGDDKASIWLSSSPDLIHWGCCRPIITAGYAWWNNMKVGPTPPIWTPEGWLEIMHGVFSWTKAERQYFIGALLLDLENPEKVIGKTQSWLLAPEADYETRGQVNNVVFPCGAIADLEKDELRLYYGAADTCIGLASGSLSDVVQACKEGV